MQIELRRVTLRILLATKSGLLANSDDGFALHAFTSPWRSPVMLFLFSSPFSMLASMVGHPHDNRAHAVILDCAWPDNQRVQDTVVHKDVRNRCLEMNQAVENERAVRRGSPFPIIRSQCGSGASSNPVVLHNVALSESPDPDPRAIQIED